MIAWKETLETARAVAAAMPMLCKAERVHIAAWGGEQALEGRRMAELVRYLGQHGVQATLHRNGDESGSIGEYTLSVAADLGADMLLMGAYGHSRAREWVLGGATRTVLESMAVPVADVPLMPLDLLIDLRRQSLPGLQDRRRFAASFPTLPARPALLLLSMPRAWLALSMDAVDVPVPASTTRANGAKCVRSDTCANRSCTTRALGCGLGDGGGYAEGGNLRSRSGPQVAGDAIALCGNGLQTLWIRGRSRARQTLDSAHGWSARVCTGLCRRVGAVVVCSWEDPAFFAANSG